VVIGIDSANVKDGYRVFQFTGDPNRSRNSGRDTLAWVREVQERGAGEIVLNCMSSDGVRRGYDVTQLQAVRAICEVPLVASGGPARLGISWTSSRRLASTRPWPRACSTPAPSRSRPQDHTGRIRHRGPAVSLDIGTIDFAKGTAWCPPSCRMPTAARC
jgi:hypothetical protein